MIAGSVRTREGSPSSTISPSWKNTIRWATSRAKPISWATTTLVIRVSVAGDSDLPLSRAPSRHGTSLPGVGSEGTGTVTASETPQAAPGACPSRQRMMDRRIPSGPVTTASMGSISVSKKRLASSS